jgi:hypothetical protein
MVGGWVDLSSIGAVALALAPELGVQAAARPGGGGGAALRLPPQPVGACVMERDTMLPR